MIVDTSWVLGGYCLAVTVVSFYILLSGGGD